MAEKKEYKTTNPNISINPKQHFLKIRRNKEEERLYLGTFYSNVQTNAKRKI